MRKRLAGVGPYCSNQTTLLMHTYLCMHTLTFFSFNLPDVSTMVIFAELILSLTALSVDSNCAMNCSASSVILSLKMEISISISEDDIGPNSNDIGITET